MSESKFKPKEILGVLAVVVLFVVVSYYAQIYQADLSLIIGAGGLLGVLAYLAITVMAVVVAPISTFPLLPVAVALWGSFWAAVYSILGWTIGSMIAFYLARRFGRPLIVRFSSIQKIERFSHRLPEKNLFFSVIILRILIPVDILSYALGLLTTMPFWLYSIATLIGVSPFAFIFSYAAGLPLGFQIGAGVLAALALVVGMWYFKDRQDR